MERMEASADPPSGADEALGELASEMGVLRGEGEVTADEIRALFALSREMFVVANFEGRFELLSPAWTAILGHTVAELCAVPFVELVHPDDRAMTRTVVERLMQNGRLVAFQNRYRHRDGSYRTLSWRSTVSVERRRFYAVAIDVTEGAAIRESSSVLSAILETAGEAIIVQSVDGIITSWNPAAERLCGWAAAEVVGKPMASLALGVITARHLRADPELGEVADRRDAVLVHKDGHEVPVSVAVTPFGDGTGHVTGAVTLARAMLRP
jgi:PAS domain S-box-containing protein